MALLDLNELVQTIVDQSHTIRRMGVEIERLQAAAAAADARLEPLPLRSVPPELPAE